ncbi:hypothetical protein EDEG_03401 [Edhazardia aedis USNM 41457]|uniref:Uncharacterized protein n=1 Tax=Edhazardia aedis (strain USNM 41457) TaxID=1003232 RepID=J9DLC3_EDHAE|nr:hypothetical protein EDEG_03401 [Edhazardia aedis USNM 41457]|eukprot:EJW02157.1 hypothetical protein EDEG_03401 [Edhazardia aedis USNM 41457]
MCLPYSLGDLCEWRKKLYKEKECFSVVYFVNSYISRAIPAAVRRPQLFTLLIFLLHYLSVSHIAQLFIRFIDLRSQIKITLNCNYDIFACRNSSSAAVTIILSKITLFI